MSWQPSAELDSIRRRALLYREIRAFFNDRDLLEVDTPLLSRSTNTDAQIASMLAYNRQLPLYLQTSPEFAMKRLLAAGSGSIYQICHAFREAESGPRHRPEFSLLEWYRVGFDYYSLMDELAQLIDALSGHSNRFERAAYRDLFLEHANLDIWSIELAELRQRSAQLAPDASTADLDFDQCLDLLLSFVIAPRLKGFLFVHDYPVSQAALARVSNRDPRVAERFELFHDGLELANGFSELTDAGIQRSRFENDNRIRAAKGLPLYPVDEHLLAALESGLPDCAGVALGLDRLLMVLLGFGSIDQTLSFVD